MEAIVVLLAILPFLLVGLGALVGWRMEEQRHQALMSLGPQLGLTFAREEKLGNPLPEPAASFPLFQTGHGRRSRNHGYKTLADGAQVHTFDYQYTSGSGKSRTTYRMTIFAVIQADLHLPCLRLHPEIPILHDIAKFFGMQDINFTSYPQFSRSYLLRGEPEAQIRQMFERGLLSFFERHPGWCLEAQGPAVILWRHNQRVPPHELRSFLSFGEEFYQRLLACA